MILNAILWLRRNPLINICSVSNGELVVLSAVWSAADGRSSAHVRRSGLCAAAAALLQAPLRLHGLPARR